MYEAPVATKFAELAASSLVHKNVISTITDQMRLNTMTEVQQRTINEALGGGDM